MTNKASDLPTFLPLPGEYIIVQQCSIEMAKALSIPELAQALTKSAHKKYCAVVYKYLEPLSPSKPWHLCLLLILAKSSPEGESESAFADCDFKIVPARLRTFSSPSTRTVLRRLSSRALCDKYTRSLGPSDKRCELLYHPGENRHYDLDDNSCTPKSPASSVDEKAQPQEPEERGVFLLPHFSFDFNAEQTVQPGDLWYSEHGAVLSKLSSYISDLPELVRLEFREETFLPWKGEEAYMKHYAVLSTENATRALIVSSPQTDPRLFVSRIVKLQVRGTVGLARVKGLFSSSTKLRTGSGASVSSTSESETSSQTASSHLHTVVEEDVRVKETEYLPSSNPAEHKQLASGWRRAVALLFCRSTHVPSHALEL